MIILSKWDHSGSSIATTQAYLHTRRNCPCPMCQLIYTLVEIVQATCTSPNNYLQHLLPVWEGFYSPSTTANSPPRIINSCLDQYHMWYYRKWYSMPQNGPRSSGHHGHWPSSPGFQGQLDHHISMAAHTDNIRSYCCDKNKLDKDDSWLYLLGHNMYHLR